MRVIGVLILLSSALMADVAVLKDGTRVEASERRAAEVRRRLR